MQRVPPTGSVVSCNKDTQLYIVTCCHRHGLPWCNARSRSETDRRGDRNSTRLLLLLRWCRRRLILLHGGAFLEQLH